MSIFEIFITALALSMDAFAVSICKGLSQKEMKWKNAVIAGLYFGGFQAGMPLLGYILGVQLKDLVTTYDHWIVFFLLGCIGANMIKEAMSKEEEEVNDSFDVKTMILLAIATSIDAFAVGVGFACISVDIIPAVILIGVTTFVCSFFGIKIGSVFGSKFKSKAEFAGGVVLILIGLKTLIEHLAA